VIVSNTEVMMKGSCGKQHYYRFGLDIEPRFNSLGPAIARGLIGHAVLDSYYVALQAGVPHHDAVNEAWDTLNEKLAWVVVNWPEDTDLIKLISKLKTLLNGYFNLYRNDTFKVHAVEKFFRTPITPDAEYGMRLDLLMEMTSGEYRGDFFVVDHKFVYNFKTPKELTMDGQLSKYVKTVRANGYIVTKGMFNQLRYRELKEPKLDDIYKRTIVRASKVKTDNIWKEQEKSTIEISKLKKLPLAEWSEAATRNLSPFVCKYCHFQTLCNLELEEQDISTELKTNFQPNTYGYTDAILADS
jgi:hypothetical protein